MRIEIINGPNLDILQYRDSTYYGCESFEQILVMLRDKFPAHEISYFQSNSEGEIIDHLHSILMSEQKIGMVINPGAYSHYSYAIADALEAMQNIPVVEVHLSNIFGREDFRSRSVTGARCRGVISGLGSDGYALAISYLLNLQ